MEIKIPVQNSLVMTKYLFLASIIFSSCSVDTKEKPDATDTLVNSHETKIPSSNTTDTNSEILITPNSKHDSKFNPVEVALIDSIGDYIQRIFVVISYNDANDTSVIKHNIKEIKKSYQISNTTAVSFFSEKKYANYKDVLFFNRGHPLPEEEYEKWMEYYYLGEFNNKTNIYKSFPGSNIVVREYLLHGL